jgi:cytosine/adenosine deaminase-related metal-dependent hydrolase
MLVVEGAIWDEAGARPAYVRFAAGRVVEVGALGTDSTRGRRRRIRGIVVPPPVNGHTHLGDAVSSREPPQGPLERLVAPPDGWKFQLLRAAGSAAKQAAMARALDRMAGEGVAATIDFREEGLAGVEALERAARGRGVEAIALGRPLKRPVDAVELDRLLARAAGIGISSAREEGLKDRERIARACRNAGKLYGLHASENEREAPERYLEPRPDLLVHLTNATDADLDEVAAAGCRVAVCPRSNALFGRCPPLAALERKGIPTLLGTDNAMFHAPSLFRELEFAYVSARLHGERVSPEFLARSAFVTPWQLLGRPERARVEAGPGPAPIVLRLPPDDPAYQLVCRASESLVLRPGRARRATRSGRGRSSR